jgi:nicotinamidase-related amidase
MTTALLLIDLQQGMFNSGQAPHEGAAVLSRVAGLIERARGEGMPVLHVQHDGGAGDPLQKGTAGFEIHPMVAPAKGEPVFEKTECNAFHRTGLDEALRRLGATRLVIAGMQTEYCIDTSCRAARDLGYRVVLIEDGHTTFDSEVLPAAQIVAHHNRTLRGAFAQLSKAGAVDWADRNL